MNINFNINDVNIILNMPEIEYIKTLLSLVNLTDKEKDIITLYYFNGLKEIEIADKYGVDTRRVSAIKQKAKSKMLSVWKYNSMVIAFANLYKNNS